LVVRERAALALARLGQEAEPVLRQALKERPTLELRLRVEHLLEALQAPVLKPGTELRSVRAVEALEQIGTVEARALLAKLAEGASAARLTREARTALQRQARITP
jgi:HEAT repeat protein